MKKIQNQKVAQYSKLEEILLGDKKQLRREVTVLKKSLKDNQNELETLRQENHVLDKANGIFSYRLKSSILSEIIKLLASTIGTGFAVNFFFLHEIRNGLYCLIGSVLIYISVLLLNRE